MMMASDLETPILDIFELWPFEKKELLLSQTYILRSLHDILRLACLSLDICFTAGIVLSSGELPSGGGQWTSGDSPD